MKHLRRPLALAALVALLVGPPGCHTMDPYRPGPRNTAPAGVVDPRPDLPGAPVGPGHPLWRMEQFFRQQFPTAHPWVLRSSPLKDPFLGVTHPDWPEGLNGAGWVYSPTGPLVVEVRDDLTDWQQRDVLLHEYAHVLAWDAAESAHGPVWAAQYGLLWKATRGEK